MTMRFEGDRQFPLDLAVLWNKLRDAKFLAACIPDASIEGEPTSDLVVCSVRPGLSFVRGNLEVTLQLTHAEPNESLTYIVTSKGIGSSSTVEANLTFSEQTTIHWTAEVKQLGGLLKAVPAGLIRGAAQKVIEDLWTSIQTKV